MDVPLCGSIVDRQQTSEYGYIEYRDGRIEQWKKVIPSADANGYEVLLPKSFPANSIVNAWMQIYESSNTNAFGKYMLACKPDTQNPSKIILRYVSAGEKYIVFARNF